MRVWHGYQSTLLLNASACPARTHSLHASVPANLYAGYVQDSFAHSGYRESLLLNFWQAYTKVAETAVRVTFKSCILDMAQSHESATAELLAAREALMQTQGDASNLAHTLAALTGVCLAFSERATPSCCIIVCMHSGMDNRWLHQMHSALHASSAVQLLHALALHRQAKEWGQRTEQAPSTTTSRQLCSDPQTCT